jgi:hypothetical protein
MIPRHWGGSLGRCRRFTQRVAESISRSIESSQGVPNDLSEGMTPRPGDRSPGFFIEPSRCWALVYDRNLQSTHCAEAPTYSGRWNSPRHDGQWWRVWSCADHVDGLTSVRESGRPR